MANVTRQIGLSLGADLCWPAAYEEIIGKLNLTVPHEGDQVAFAVERVSIEPFKLDQPVKYDLVIDRLTHWYNTSREWIKKAVIMDGLYVLNNPWSIQSMEKHSTYAAMTHLGLPVPETWLIPPKEYPDISDLPVTLQRYAKLFDIRKAGSDLGYPVFMKPYDGGAWVGVSKIDNDAELIAAYEDSGTRLMHLQKAVAPFDLFTRAIGIGPQVWVVKYNPDAALHARYEVAFNFVSTEEWQTLADTCLTINSFFGWDFNSCESLRKDGVFYPIDFANACPDFQVTSLHFHWPVMVKNMIKWSLFCAATKRPMRKTLDWDPYYAVVKKDLSQADRLKEYAKIAKERLDTDRFVEFCDQHLGNLDEVAWEFFGTERCKDIVRAKVTAIFPAHEIEKFTEHFFGLVQFWRKTEVDRMAAAKVSREARLAAKYAVVPEVPVGGKPRKAAASKKKGA
jgi:hypothetical protein